MRVLVISVRADHGGGPRHIELLLRYYSDTMTLFIACPDEQPYGARFSALTSFQSHTLPHRRFKIRAALGLVAYARSHEIEVIHTHGKGAGLYGRFVSCLLGKPCLHTPHGVHVGRYGRLMKWLYVTYENITSRWINHLIFVSDEERVSAKRERLWSRVRYSVISNGVDTMAIDDVKRMRRSMRISLGVADDALIVATLSRFDYAKNMQEAYQVVKGFPEATFIWVGDGEDAADLKLQAQVDGADNLRFLGALDDPAEALAAADIYLSTSRWEGSPLAVLEAMASGLPVVASDVTGHREVVGESGGGLLYPLGSPEEAVAALAKLSANKAWLRQMGDRGREVQRTSYSAAKMAKRVTAVYEQLTSNKAGR